MDGTNGRNVSTLNVNVFTAPGTAMVGERSRRRPDADFRFDNGSRVVQFTPPRSARSVQFGTDITSAVPGSATRSP